MKVLSSLQKLDLMLNHSIQGLYEGRKKVYIHSFLIGSAAVSDCN